MSEHDQETVLATFTERLEEFMAQVVHMHNRQNELETALAYLLSKDPQWMANFNAAQQAEQENREPESLIVPE